MDTRLRQALETALGETIRGTTVLHGGDFATAFRLELTDGSRVFAKYHPAPPEDFFETEAAGLHWLRSAGCVPVPAVLAVGDDPAFLVLEWIEPARGRNADEATFGQQLAALHRSGAECFGRTDRRTTGSLALPNDPCDSWSEFLVGRRLDPLARIAARRRALPVALLHDLDRLMAALPEWCGPEEPAARLHGDLWAGNRLVDRAGRSWLIDPACFGGHREFDLAMMRLFGGFGAEAFRAYAEVHPLAEGWQERVALHQLAPLLVHAIKFGGSYVSAAGAAIRRYL